MLAQSNYPSYLRIGKANEVDVHNQTPSVKWGSFVQIRVGSHGFVFFTGSVGKLAVEASNFLRGNGKLISVYSVPFVSHLDMSVLESVPNYSKVVVVEEHFARGGLTTALLEAFNQIGKFINVLSVSTTLEDLSLTGSQEFLREKSGITVEKIVQHF
jgi:transketolase